MELDTQRGILWTILIIVLMWIIIDYTSSRTDATQKNEQNKAKIDSLNKNLKTPREK